MTSLLKVTAGAIALTASLGAQAAVIDLFSTDQAQIFDTQSGVGPVVTSTAGSGADATILGGYRDLVVDKIAQAVGTSGATRIGVSGGVLSFSNDSLVSGTAKVQWDGNGDAPNYENLNITGLGGVDVTEGGKTIGFQVLTIKSDGNYQFEVNAYTSATRYTRITLQGSAVPFTPAGVASFLPFAGFSACGFSGGAVVSVVCGAGGAVDFSNLGSLELVFDPLGQALDLDVTVDLIQTVPEPSALALLGLGLVGFAAARRRKAA